jgi:hypothetical protein
LPHQFAKRLRDGGIRNIALVLIELARNEIAMLRDNRLAQRVDQRRLPDARVPGNRRQRRLAGCHHALEDAQQSLDLRAAPVQFVRDLEALRDIICAEQEGLDPPRGPPLCETPIEIGA